MTHCLLSDIARQLEMLNIFIGFEQANKYAIRRFGFLFLFEDNSRRPAYRERSW